MRILGCGEKGKEESPSLPTIWGNPLRKNHKDNREKTEWGEGQGIDTGAEGNGRGRNKIIGSEGYNPIL